MSLPIAKPNKEAFNEYLRKVQNLQIVDKVLGVMVRPFCAMVNLSWTYCMVFI